MWFLIYLYNSKSVHPFEKYNKLNLSVISGFTNMVYGKNTKTQQCRKLTENFAKQRLPIANIWNCLNKC